MELVKPIDRRLVPPCRKLMFFFLFESAESKFRGPVRGFDIFNEMFFFEHFSTKMFCENVKIMKFEAFY